MPPGWYPKTPPEPPDAHRTTEGLLPFMARVRVNSNRQTVSHGPRQGRRKGSPHSLPASLYSPTKSLFRPSPSIEYSTVSSPHGLTSVKSGLSCARDRVEAFTSHPALRLPSDWEPCFPGELGEPSPLAQRRAGRAVLTPIPLTFPDRSGGVTVVGLRVAREEGIVTARYGNFETSLSARFDRD